MAPPSLLQSARAFPRTSPTLLHPRGLPAPTAAPGSSGLDPSHINNGIVLGVFAFIFALLILGTIWFFLIAPNGGFEFKEGDWEDYKSTVLRRKGKDGKTLTNATPSTELGMGSVEGSWSEKGKSVVGKRSRGKAMRREVRRDAEKGRYEGEGDADVRQYRKEKAATVGGMNKVADGSYYDQDTDRSAMFTSPPSTDAGGNTLHSPHGTPTKSTPRTGERPKGKGFLGLRGGAAGSKGHQTIPSTDNSAVRDFAYSDPSYTESATPSPTKPRASNGIDRRNASRSPEKRSSAYADRHLSSPSQQQRARDSRSYPQQYARPSHRSSASHGLNDYQPHHTPNGSDISSHLDGSNRYSQQSATNSEAGLTANPAQIAGTKVYRHPIPGLTFSGAVTDSVLESGVGGRKKTTGYRRDPAAVGIRKVTNEHTGRRTAGGRPGGRRDSLDSD